MSEEKKVCYEITGPDNKSREPKHWVIFCPACKCAHVFDGRWKFNGNQMKPTFTPSMLVNKSTTEETCNVNRHRCHSFVTDGKIKFLGDCTHDMKNQTVDLKVF